MLGDTAADAEFYNEDPALERSFRGHKGGVTSVVWNPNLRQLITGSLDASVMVWNFKPALRAFRFAGHKASVAQRPCWRGCVWHFHASLLRCAPAAKPCCAQQGPVYSVAFSAQNGLIASGSKDKTIRFWLPTVYAAPRRHPGAGGRSKPNAPPPPS